jgi:hypothetical protein
MLGYNEAQEEALRRNPTRERCGAIAAASWSAAVFCRSKYLSEN